MYFFISFYTKKTFYLDKKQWHPAEPEIQKIDQGRLNKALDYVEKPGGSWAKTTIRGHESLVARGDGVQGYIDGSALGEIRLPGNGRVT